MKDISSSQTLSHYPVMLKEVIKICDAKKGGLFIDCTYGGGGYTNKILSYPNTKVIALDRDPNIKSLADKTKKNYKNRFFFHNSKFSQLNKILSKNTEADSIIFDLGLSSLQLLDFKRGFSFNSKGEPDMRMGLNENSAKDVLNNLDMKTLSNIFKLLGEEKESSRISRNIVKERQQSPIKTIPDLIKVIKKSKRKNFKKKINLSTQVFQALRIFVNKEVTELIKGLINATQFLKKDGKIIVITFHSIEDKIVKFFFTNFSSNKSKTSRYYPENYDKKTLFEIYKNKIIKPSLQEVEENNPSRSAKLRYAVRSKDNFVYPVDLEKKFFRYLELERTDV
tara:strand:+ start:2269 stop:3282 length:1014 start_codon:yes stop_codon:yes gene_type:complete